jgi:[acyl-carrier-protein] S-malonyltransferase
MQAALAEVEVQSPIVPLVANVLAMPISDPDEIRQRLVEQVTSQVRWRETITWLGDNGVTSLVEVGSGKVLSGLAKRINRDLSSKSVGTADDVAAFFEANA